MKLMLGGRYTEKTAGRMRRRFCGAAVPWECQGKGASLRGAQREGSAVLYLSWEQIERELKIKMSCSPKNRMSYLVLRPF